MQMTPKWHPLARGSQQSEPLVPKVALQICNVSPMCTVPSEDLSSLPILTARPRRGGAAAATEHLRHCPRPVGRWQLSHNPALTAPITSPPFQGKGVHQISSPSGLGWRSRDPSQGSLINDGYHAAMVRFCCLGALRPSFQPRGSHLRVFCIPAASAQKCRPVAAGLFHCCGWYMGVLALSCCWQPHLEYPCERTGGGMVAGRCRRGVVPCRQQPFGPCPQGPRRRRLAALFVKFAKLLAWPLSVPQQRIQIPPRPPAAPMPWTSIRRPADTTSPCAGAAAAAASEINNRTPSRDGTTPVVSGVKCPSPVGDSSLGDPKYPRKGAGTGTL